MLQTFQATLSPMLVMFLCIVIGFVLKKANLLPDSAGTVMSKLENYVFVPALIIHTFMNYCTVASLTDQYSLILYSTVALLLGITIAIPLSKVFSKNDAYRRNVYKYALTFGNFSFMGNAIVPAILGSVDPEILYKYMLYTLPLNLVVYTWGIVILIPAGENKGNFLKKLLNPVCVSILLGALLGLIGVQAYVPSFLLTVVNYCKGCMAPVAMILTGFVIGGYRLSDLLKNTRVYVATVLRLFVIPALLLTVLYLLGASDTVMILTLFAFATPLGMNTVVFPAAYGGETHTGAAMAMISHTLCVVSIPLMYSLLTWILALI